MSKYVISWPKDVKNLADIWGPGPTYYTRYNPPRPLSRATIQRTMFLLNAKMYDTRIEAENVIKSMSYNFRKNVFNTAEIKEITAEELYAAKKEQFIKKLANA